MHLLSKGKHSLSILELKRQVGLCYSAAWVLKHKVLQVMMEREDGRVLSGRVEVDDAYNGGQSHDGNHEAAPRPTRECWSFWKAMAKWAGMVRAQVTSAPPTSPWPHQALG
jgi:hypothetical protein